MDIEHDPAGHRFVARCEAGLAVLEYDLLPDGILDVYHTYVPPGGRGRGVAAQLVQAAVDHARVAGYRIRPSCSYVAAWLRDHPGQGDRA